MQITKKSIYYRYYNSCFVRFLILAFLVSGTEGCTSAVVGAGATTGLAIYDERGIKGVTQDALTKARLRAKILEYSTTLATKIGIDVYANTVLLTGAISDEKLKFLIQNAKVFCFPSLYEGFGLPIIESMACGCPVIASNVSSIPEITGDAAILVDPRNVEELVTALNKILTDDRLREDLSKKSYLNSSKYRWQNSASKAFQTILS